MIERIYISTGLTASRALWLCVSVCKGGKLDKYSRCAVLYAVRIYGDKSDQSRAEAYAVVDLVRAQQLIRS